MADFPRYDGHLYIDAYQADIVKKITAGDDVTVTSGDLALQDGKASIAFSATASTGLNISTPNPASEPTITLTSVNGITTLQNNTLGQTELLSTGPMKLGYEATSPSSLTLYAGAGTNPIAVGAIQVRTTSATGTTFNNGEVTINTSGKDMNFAVKTDGFANGSFSIDAGTGVADFASPMIVKTGSDVYHKTPTYNTDFNPAIRINAASESYTNKLLTLFTNDFSVETTSFTGATPAFRLNYASDTLTIKVPTTFDGDVTHTSGTTIDFTGTTVIGLPTTGVTGLDGGVTWQNSGVGNPDLTVDDGTLSIRAWEWNHNAGDMEWKINPDSNPAYEFKVYSQNGLPDIAVDEGGVGVDGRFTFYGEKFQIFPRPVSDGGQGGYVEYYISDGTKVMEWNLQDSAVTANKGYRFDVKDSITGAGKFELNTTSQSDMDFVVNTSTISDSFYIDYGNDSLEFKGILAAPWPTHRDTEANLATSLTEPGDIAYGNDADELVTRTNFTSGGGRNYNHFMNSTVQYTFAEDITSWNWGTLGFAFIAPAGLTPNSGSSLGGWVDQGYPETQPFRIVSARVNHEDGPDDASDYNSWRCIVSGDLGGSLKTVTSTAFRTEGLMPVLTQPIPFYKGLTYNILYESRDGYYDFIDPTDPTEWDGGVVLIGFRRFGSNYSTSTATPPGKTIAAVEIMTYRLI